MGRQNNFYQQLIGFIERKSLKIISLNVAIVIFVTLLPFNFRVPANFDLYTDFTWQAWAAQFKRTVKFYDIVTNILLFMPLGLGFAALFSQASSKLKKRVIVLSILISLSFGFFLSLAVECGQIFLSTRQSSIIDLTTNSLGTVIGSLIFWILILGRPSFEKYFAHLDFLTKRSHQFKLATLLWLSYLALMMLLILNVQDLTKLSNWDPDFPLIIGNEKTRDRPWKGEIDDVCIADQAWSRSQIVSLLQAQDSCSNLTNNSDLVAAYSFAEIRSSYPDLIGKLPDLEVQTKDSSKVVQTKGVISHNRWFKTSEAVTDLNKRLQNSSQFTLLTEIATADFEQKGPARIITLSSNQLWRNLTLAQWQEELSLRIRMPLTKSNGKRPEIRVKNFFLDKQAHRLAITYDGVWLKFYRDRPYYHTSLYLGSEAALFWSFLSLFADKVYLNPSLDLVNQSVYYLVIFAPLGVLWGIVFNLLRFNSFGSWSLGVSGLVVPPLLVEGLIATTNRSWIWSHLAWGLAFVTGSFLVTRIYYRVKLLRQKS